MLCDLFGLELPGTTALMDFQTMVPLLQFFFLQICTFACRASFQFQVSRRRTVSTECKSNKSNMKKNLNKKKYIQLQVANYITIIIISVLYATNKWIRMQKVLHIALRSFEYQKSYYISTGGFERCGKNSLPNSFAEQTICSSLSKLCKLFGHIWFHLLKVMLDLCYIYK